MGSLVSWLVRCIAAPASLLAAGATSAACIFSLEDVTLKGGDGSADGGTQPFDGSDGDGSVNDGSGGQDAALSLTLLGRACVRGRIGSLAITGETLLALCSEAGWSLDGTAAGGLVRAPARDAFGTGTPIDTQGNVLGTSPTDAYLIGTCGLARIDAQGSVLALTPVLPTSFTALRASTGSIYFAGVGNDGVSAYDVGQGQCGDTSSCTPLAGCTRTTSAILGTSMGLAATNNGGRVDYVCAHETKRASLIPYSNSAPQTAIYSGDPGGCGDNDVPLGAAADGNKVYFGVGSSLFSCKVGAGSTNCGVSSMEGGPVTLVTGNVAQSAIAWAAGTTVRVMKSGGNPITIGELDDRATAIAFDGDTVLVGTLGGLVYRAQ